VILALAKLVRRTFLRGAAAGMLYVKFWARKRADRHKPDDRWLRPQRLDIFAFLKIFF
jgi:hypothetical protein